MNSLEQLHPFQPGSTNPGASWKQLVRIGFILALLFAAGSAFAKQQKILVCHVGNQPGSDGATYLENPDCVPPEGYTVDDYVCPDAGKIDLIVVPRKSAHLDNPSHYWDDGEFAWEDYEPGELGASGEGTEDTDGDGIDEGCEPAAASCPCWDELELQAVTQENQNSVDSCNRGPAFPWPDYATIQDNLPPPGGAGFTGDVTGLACGMKGQAPQTITAQEAAACVEQIRVRCLDLCTPIDGSELPGHCLP